MVRPGRVDGAAPFVAGGMAIRMAGVAIEDFDLPIARAGLVLC
jgi:hypothetical protein